MKKRKRPLPNVGDLVLVRIDTYNLNRSEWLMPRAPRNKNGVREFPNIMLPTNKDHFGYVLSKYKQPEGGAEHWVYHILLGEDILFLQTSLFGTMVNAQLTFKAAPRS